jgi:hypothetical protein
VSRPLAGVTCWLGDTSGSQSSGRGVATTAEAEVGGKSTDEPVTHGAEGVEVGDVVLVQGTLGENGAVAGEEDVCLDISDDAIHRKKMVEGHTGDISGSVALVAVQVIVRETGPGHDPRGFTGDLGMISVRVAKDTVVHLTVAVVVMAC